MESRDSPRRCLHLQVFCLLLVLFFCRQQSRNIHREARSPQNIWKHICRPKTSRYKSRLVLSLLRFQKIKNLFSVNLRHTQRTPAETALCVHFQTFLCKLFFNCLTAKKMHTCGLWEETHLNLKCVQSFSFIYRICYLLQRTRRGAPTVFLYMYDIPLIFNLISICIYFLILNFKGRGSYCKYCVHLVVPV